MKRWGFAGLGVVVLLLGMFVVVKRVSPISWGLWGTQNTSSELAIKGYDPVAYFELEQPAQGSNLFVHDWGGATWQFSSVENRDLFAGRPESYAPQFGGFCSFAVSKGFTADASPDAWHIEDGKLYMFMDKNVRNDWVAGIGEGSLEKSTANWAKR